MNYTHMSPRVAGSIPQMWWLQGGMLPQYKGQACSRWYIMLMGNNQSVWQEFIGIEGAANQSCNEDSLKILGEGRWYWIHDFVATFEVNNRPIYMALCS